MTCSVVIPCHNCADTLPNTLQSVRSAARDLQVEIVQVDDEAGRGLSWARNAGIERSHGDAVFFVDADDTVRPGFFSKLAALLESTGSDFVISSFDYAPLKRDYDLTGNGSIRSSLLPAFYGYDFDDVRRWNAGGALAERREQGGVWRCAFRRDFLDRHHIRFDENLRLYEDSPFIAECALYADRVSSTREVLYEYTPGANGILATSLGTERYWQYKFAALENRRAIDRRAGGGVLEHFAASAVFSALELMKSRRGARRYCRDEFVAESLRRFPISPRHPLAAAAVIALRAAI